LRDRFGPLPAAVTELMNTVRLRKLAIAIGFEKIVIKMGKLVGFFISNPESPFYSSEEFKQVIRYIQEHPKKVRMKETGPKLSLIFDHVTTINEAIVCLQQLTGVAAKA
jgi:transcription-repair coupling factor (superfamily II helicase)